MNSQQLTLDDAPKLRSPGKDYACHGDPVVDELRIARNAFNRTLKTLRGCLDRSRYCVDYLEAGPFFEGVVDDLESGEIDSLTARFGSWGHQALETIEEARDEEKESKGYPIPEPDTWKDLESLANALIDHGKSVRDLGKAESAAMKHEKLSPASGDASGSPAVAKCVPVGDPPTLAGVYGSTHSGGVSGEEVKP